MTELPPPLTPPDCELRDFAFMPLDVDRLRDSDLTALETPEAFRAAVLLWCASWHQVPAASLPDDDRVLSKLAGYGYVVKEWMNHRSGALRGWVKCSDGRLYHPIVAEKANESWFKKLHYAWKKECDRLRQANKKRAGSGLPDLPYPPEPLAESFGIPLESAKIPPEKEGVPLEKAEGSNGKQKESDGNKESSAGIPLENALKGEGQGEGQGQGEFKNKSMETPSLASTVGAAEEEKRAGYSAGEISRAMIDNGVQSNPADPRLIALAEQGVTPETVAEACKEAKKARPNENIKPGYVFAIISRWAADAARLRVAGARSPPTTKQDSRAAAANSIGLGASRHDHEPTIIDNDTGHID